MCVYIYIHPPLLYIHLTENIQSVKSTQMSTTTNTVSKLHLVAVAI